jgi:hypothetical protein
MFQTLVTISTANAGQASRLNRRAAARGTPARLAGKPVPAAPRRKHREPGLGAG